MFNKFKRKIKTILFFIDVFLHYNNEMNRKLRAVLGEFQYREVCQINSINAHLFFISKNKNKYVLHIVLGRPGTLIGKAGKNIDTFKEKISNIMEKEIKINMIEFSPFTTKFKFKI